MKKENKKATSWLKRIQEGSWEPEILISGIVLYGLFQIPSLIDQLYIYLENYSYAILDNGLNLTLTSLLKISTVWLVIGFISHLFFRSVWAAFVGLSFVYKRGVQIEKLQYPHLFKKHLSKNNDYKNQIIRLEKICSTIFSISFLIFMWVVGLGFALIVLGGILILFIEIFPNNSQNLLFLDPSSF